MPRPHNSDNGFLQVQIGETRKKKLVNYHRNTKNSIESLIETLVDNDVVRNPDNYIDHITPLEEIKASPELEDKVVLILERAGRMVSKRYISSGISKASDVPLDRPTLSTTLEVVLDKEIFFNSNFYNSDLKTKPDPNKPIRKKHLRYGLSKWLPA